MLKRRIASLVLALAFLLSTIGPALAAPLDSANPGQVPPGLARKTFVHYDREFARKTLGLQTSAAAVTEAECDTPGSATCPTFLFDDTRWDPNTVVTYYVNLNYKARTSTTLTQAGATEAIRESFAAWQQKMPASGGVTYSYAGATKLTPGKRDGRNVVGWGPLSSGILAQTSVWYYPSTGQIVETDIAFNNLVRWAYAPPECDVSQVNCNPGSAGPAGSYDLLNIGTHEAGHTLMLLDLYDTSNSGLTMYGRGGARERIKDSLGTGDIAGISAAYKPT